MFKLTKDSDIPLEGEEAALHIIKQKMKKLVGKSIQFKTGGQRVSYFSLFKNKKTKKSTLLTHKL